MAASKPSRDALDGLVHFLGRTSGRDKLCRSVQYACALMLAHLRHGGGGAKAVAPAEHAKMATAAAAAAREETLTKVAASMSMCRKVLRFGRTFEFARAIAASPVPERPADAARLLSKCFLLAYFAADHVSWAGAVGVASMQKETLARVADATNHFWLGNLVCDIAAGFSDVRAAERAHRAGAGKLTADRLAAVRRAMLRNFLDLLVCLVAVRRLSLPPRVVALFGLTTSLMGVYDVVSSM